ncbi:MAG TPA: pantetheine-phosphate adenylyltransferase [Acidimicrobiia bacterium]|nr:pantetheine-phosphate adenylyltransferase [Acidimicrobiia bacterium]
MTTALCPGSFDPPTLGHVDVVERAIKVFDRVVVSVVDNPSKESMFTIEQRIALLEELFGNQVTVTSFSGLLITHAIDQGADVVVKGLRSIDDYEYEKQMSQMNRHLSGMETVYMSTAAEYGFVSSSLVKEVAKLGGDVTALVPQAVARALKEKLE